MRFREVAQGLLAFVLIVYGVSLVSIPAAVIVAGLLLIVDLITT